MLVSCPCSWLESPRPRSFAGLMEMYEANYMRLRRLYPEPYDVEDCAVSQVRGTVDLHLEVLARSSYTSTLRLTYYLKDQHGALNPDPDIRLRVYHDALQAEVLSWSSRWISRHACARASADRHALSGKWTMNRFLYKWLNYCLRQGHHFPKIPANSIAAPRSLVALTVE